MYLHRLDLRAVGPYPDLVSIDFAALAASGVFLLEGPTGSGKSTIIDAVVFALYGGLAGESATPDRLHSQHADPGVEPFVDLVFETGAGVYRVRRTPQYDRPKQRGTGTVRQQASAQLFRLAHPADTVGEPVSSRIPEVGLEVARIVGLDKVQFLQTVVLPQGEFARFLRSPGEERRKLLQSLFGTQVYDRTAEELAARRRAVQAEVEGADARVRDALSRFAQAAGIDDPDEQQVEPTVAALRSTADEAAAARDAAVAEAEAAALREQTVRARLAARERRVALLDRQRALDDGAARIVTVRERLGLAARATPVVLAADALGAARDRATRAAEAAAALRARVGLRPHADATGRRTALTAFLGEVRHLVTVEDSLATRRRARSDATRLAGELLDRVAALDDEIARRPTERAELVERLRAATERAADAEAARLEVERVAHLRAELAARDLARGSVETAERAVATARTTAERALAAEHDVRSRRIAGLAGELGAALEAGSPCPVCGAVEHPDPAAPQDDHPSVEAVEAAARTTRIAETALSDAAVDLAVARALLDRLDETVGALDVGTLAERATAADARVAAAQQAAVQVRDLDRQRDAHDEGTAALERERDAVRSRHAVLVATGADEDRRLADDTAAVDAALGRAREHLATGPQTADSQTTGPRTAEPRPTGSSTGRSATATHPSTDRPSTLHEAVAALDLLVAELDAVLVADAGVTTAERIAEDRQRDVRAALDQHDLADVAEARSARLTTADEARLRAEVTAAERERAVVEAGLAAPDVVEAAALGDEPLDVDAVHAARVQAADRAEAATRTAQSAADRAAAAAACAVDLGRAVRSRDATSARSRAVVRLADVASGVTSVNPSGITLGTYVLMRRFEDVVAAANDRLRGMLAGRFTLETSDEREAGSRARRTGLALAVHDHTTDTLRAPGSLSGGETFTVSLCLALGLADVVQAEAGGVALGTLFVDEGFGTLDPETLDDVIGQLSRLTAGGRQVGIVSHVEELKQRIPERIAVRRAPGGGSRVTTTV